MKKFLIVLVALFALFAIGGAGLYCYYKGSNPWNAKTIGDIPAPAGFLRVEANAGSYAEFLRRQPLKEKGAKIELFTGGDANYQCLETAVIDNQLLSNYEQCADVTMRLRAEYLWQQGRYSEICFQDGNRNEMRDTGGASRKSFEKYMRQVYGMCSTYRFFMNRNHVQ